MMDDDLYDLFGDDRARRGGGDEATARLAIERALSALGDAAARARVLRWAVERFAIDSASTPPDHEPLPSNPPDQRSPHDPGVAVDDLADLFNARDGLDDVPTKPEPRR